MLIMLLMAVAFALQVHFSHAQILQRFVLNGWSWTGLLGYSWLHLGLIHVIENIVLLWFFGRKAARELGPWVFSGLYLCTGLFAGITHVALDGHPAIGASGAVMGILGVHATLYYRDFGRIGPVLLAVWVGLTIGLGIAGVPGTAHMSHLGGFCMGVFLASFLVVRGNTDASGVHPDWLRWLRVSYEEEAVAAPVLEVA
jgi:membrane associated rhomboid family serine protease